MPDIEIKYKSIDELTDLFINSLPNGYLYDDSLKSFVRGFVGVYQEFLLEIEKACNGMFTIDSNNIFLEELKIMYGLPNILFPDIKNNSDAAFAVSMMKLSKKLISKQDFENFMLLLGYDVTFYHFQRNMIAHSRFPYQLPNIFTKASGKKNKLKYWIYIAGNEAVIPNINRRLPLIFRNPSNSLTNAKNILDFLKPDYLIFEYITTRTKNLFRL